MELTKSKQTFATEIKLKFYRKSTNEGGIFHFNLQNM